MASIIASISLFCKDSNSDKEYNITLEQSDSLYVVNFSYGKRGNATSTGTKTNSPVDLDKAKLIYSKLINEKQAKGYKPDGNVAVSTGISSVSPNDKVSTGLFPQLLNPIEESEMERYITDNRYLAQEKLDGKRIMAESEVGGVTTSNRKGLKCGVPSEIEQGVSVFRGTIIDGEMIGNNYHVFDILRLGGDDLRNDTCLDRFNILKRIMAKCSPNNLVLVRCEVDEAGKRRLVKELAHKEGVVFKLKDSVYTPGRPTKLGSQLKCKFWSDVTVQVLKINDKASIQVGILDGTKMIPVGNVTINGHATPNVGDCVDVTYLYAYKGGSLYQPKYRGIRDDHDCDQITALKFKSEDSDD
jgi:bifunctional non-homologous end joining protein LigD